MTEGHDKGWSVQRSKRKRTNTGSIDEETFQSMSNDQKLGVIFQKLIDIEDKQSSIKKLEKSLESTDKTVRSIKSTMDGHSNMIKLLTYKSLDLEARSRRKNLVFRGLCENSREDCHNVIADFLSNELDLNPDFICMDRAHRIGRRPIRCISRRPIIVAFRDYQDTVRIMERANRLTDTRFGIDRDYPSEISKARKLLWNRYKELKAVSSSPSDIALEYPARIVVGKTVVDDAFPDWFEVLKGARLEPSISEDVKSANSRAETRRKSRMESFQRVVSTAGLADSDHGAPERENSHDIEDTDDPADTAFYSGYVSSRMRPQEQVAWGNGMGTNITDKTDTLRPTVSMRDFPPLTNSTQIRPGPSVQPSRPGFGMSNSASKVDRSSSSKMDRKSSEQYSAGQPQQQASSGQRQQTVNSDNNRQNGQPTDTRKIGSRPSGQAMGENNTQPPGTNNVSGAERPVYRDKTAKK